LGFKPLHEVYRVKVCVNVVGYWLKMLLTVASQAVELKCDAMLMYIVKSCISGKREEWGWR